MYIKHMSLTHTRMHAHIYTHEFVYVHTLVRVFNPFEYSWETILPFMYIWSPQNFFLSFPSLKKDRCFSRFFRHGVYLFFRQSLEIKRFAGQPFAARCDPNNNHRTMYYIPTVLPIRYMTFCCKRKKL